jgi:hypothetical protein
MNKPRFTNIVATSFAGQGDVERSAYTGRVIDGDKIGASLPYHFPGAPPTLSVFYNGNSVSAIPLLDVGPWNINDPYWNGSGRPEAESGRDNTGRRTNSAGIDLTPGTWELLGYDGNPSEAMEKVDWDFDSYLNSSITPVTPKLITPPWLVNARSYVGKLTWNHGPMPQAIQAWMQNIATQFPEMADETKMLVGMGKYWEWCGGFVQSMLSYSKIRGPFTDPKEETTLWPWAFAWADEDWGATEVTDPLPGDVLVFKWANCDGHVTFYDTYVSTDDLYHCTGGDQGASLSVSTEGMPMASCIAIRRPPALVS